MSPVYVFEIEDADADSWSAEAAVVADTPAGAARRIRAAGLHKRQIRNDGRPTRVAETAEIPAAEDAASGIARRRSDDAGWTAWEVLPDGVSLNWRISGTATVQGRGSGHR